MTVLDEDMVDLHRKRRGKVGYLFFYIRNINMYSSA
jgi:hypothetical protein